MTTPFDPQPAPVSAQPADSQPAQPRAKPWLNTPTGIIVGASTLLLFVVCCGWWLGRVNTTPPAARVVSNPLVDAKRACAPDDSAVRLADGSKTLLVDGAGDEDAGASIQTIACLLRELDTPAAVVAKMDGTNALAGRQEASWEGFTASWTYHPGNGLDLIVQAKG